MSDQERPSPAGMAPARGGAPVWWVVFTREMTEQWLGGRALILILIYTALLGMYSWLMSTNSELNLLPLREMVYEMVKAAIAMSLCICMIIAADSISGERERATLEGLLLTPANRTQIVLGKFLTAISPWPVAYVIAVPYWYAVSQGDPIFERAFLWGGVVGSLLAPVVGGIGILLSILCNTIKASMIAGQSVYMLLLLPAQVGGVSGARTYQQLVTIYLVDWVNPMAASNRFLQRTLLDNWSPDVLWIWFTMPVVAAALVMMLLVRHGSPALQLEAVMAERFRPYWERLGTLWRMTGFASRSPV